MLTELHIKDFAIIDDLNLTFGPSFVVLTGETGAGKSIIVDAVELLVGGRADSTAVRTGADAALIEGIFRVDAAIRDEVHAILRREELLDDPAYVVLGREIRQQGRNVCRVNGRLVTLGLLRELGEWLIDLHGQSEHLSLLRVREHLALLDRYAETEPLRQEYAQIHRALGEVRRELSASRAQESEAARRLELLTFQVEEIGTASLRPGEDEALSEERSRLANAEQLTTLTEQAIAALDEAPDRREAATDLLGRAAHALSGLARIDPSMQRVQEDAQALAEQVSDLARRLRVYREGIEFNPRRLNEVEERLEMIGNLKRKYGETVEAVLAYGESARQELESITHAEERLRELEGEEIRLLSHLGEVGNRLSQARREAAERLRQAIEGELGDLRMEGASFGVDLRWQDDPAGAPVGDQRVAFSPTGLDQVEFLVAPNPGEGLKPLAKIASGGETSRLMLGLKGVLAQADQTPTLIFDEIDQGIGGRAGAVVGRKLWEVARRHQVLCITHLPQLAAYGDQQIKVEKVIEGGRTITAVRQLDEPERIPELALMLGKVSEPNLESAADLLRHAAASKVTAKTV